MADNVTFQPVPATPPNATVVATDDVGGVHFQRTKVDVGADGASSPLVRGQQTTALSLPVALSSEQQAQLAAIVSALGGTLTIAGTVITGGLTDTELRANPVPVSAASLPLPAGAATAANQQTDALTDTELRATPVPVSASSLPLPTGAATAANQQTDALTDTQLRATPVPISGTVTAEITDVGVTSVPADPFGVNADAASDTGSISAKLRSIATNITTLLTRVPAALTGAGNFKVAVQEALPVGTNNIGDVDVAGGNVASGAADSGNPVKVGGVYNATPPTLGDGNRGNLNVDLRGNLKASLWDRDGTTGVDVNGAGADGVTNSVFSLWSTAYSYGFNGTSWDRLRSDTTNGLDVDVTRVPADPFGTNADAAATAGGTGSIQAKLRRISTDINTLNTNVSSLRVGVGAQTDMTHGQVSAGTSATEIAGARSDRKSIIVKNISATVVFVGKTGVTVATGVRLNENESIELDTTVAIFGITSSGNATVAFAETHPEAA